MVLDQFLSQPPAEVADRGFSQAVAVRRFHERACRALLVRAAASILLLLVLAFVPGILLRDIPQLLAALAFSPMVPVLGGGVFLLLLALQPRWLRV